MHYFIRITLISLLLSLVGCGGQKLPFIAEEGTILAFGDSLTDGKGVRREHSYPSVLAELSGRTVINAGVSGEITADGLERLTELLNEIQPDLLILLEGGNDILRGLNLSETEQNLSNMIRLAKTRNIPVLLIAVPEKALFSTSAAFYHRLAEQHQVILMDDLIASLLKKAELKSDSVHFNQQGYRIMAEAIYAKLRKHGALK